MKDKHIEMEEVEFFEMTPEELHLIKTAVMVCYDALPVEHEDHDALQRLLVKLFKM